MEKEILLNDQDLKVKCILEENRISFEFDKNLDFLNDLLRIERTDNLVFVYLGLKKILRIEGTNVERILPITDTEVRILRALYENNKGMNSINIIDCFNSVKNNVSKSGFSFKLFKGKAKTESHTILTEILDSEELIRFLNEYDVNYPMNEYGILDFSCDKYYSYEQVKYNGWLANLMNAIRVNLARNVDYRDIIQANKNREKLLKLACYSLEDMLGDTVEWKKIESDIKKASEDIMDQIRDIDDNLQGKSSTEKKRLNKGKNKLNEKLNKLNNLKAAQAAKILYNELLNISLDKLTNNKVSYSLISSTNDARIDFMSRKHPNDKRFSFIYSIDKDKSVKKFEEYAKSLEMLFDTNMLSGADLNGFEVLTDKEYSSLREKFECVLPVLRIHPGSVLRLHASNYTDSTDNIYKALTCLRDAIIKINEACVDLFGSEWGTLNPPALRIAHPIRFENHSDLVNLVKAFNATIEYDLSSNKSLKTVDHDKISLAFYDKNDIKYVFSSDGGGMFYTDYNQDLIGAAEIHDTIKEMKELTEEVEDDEDEITDTELTKEFDTYNEEPKEEEEVKPVFDAFPNEVPTTKEEVIVEEPKKEETVEVKKEEISEEEAEDEDIFDNIDLNVDDVSLEEDDIYHDEELEQTLYDLFADIRKEKKDEIQAELTKFEETIKLDDEDEGLQPVEEPVVEEENVVIENPIEQHEEVVGLSPEETDGLTLVFGEPKEKEEPKEDPIVEEEEIVEPVMEEEPTEEVVDDTPLDEETEIAPEPEVEDTLDEEDVEFENPTEDYEATLEEEANEEEITKDEDDYLEKTNIIPVLTKEFIDEPVKPNNTFDSYAEALEEENLLFTRDGVLLSEKEKVEDELSKVLELIDLNPDLNMEYINNKIERIRELNENSNTSDNAKMYLFLLEREMFPQLITDLKSIEYLYKHKDKEKNNIEKELNRLFGLVSDQYEGLL